MRADPDSALTLIDEGLAIAKETGEHFTDPYLYRLRGEFLLSGGSRELRSCREGLPNRHRDRENGASDAQEQISHRESSLQAKLRASLRGGAPSPAIFLLYLCN